MTQGKNFKNLSQLDNKKIKYVLCDIDDTLTNEGKLFSEAYDSLWLLKRAGYNVVPITGRPAGWCEMIARFWPVEGVVGENGAFYFYYDKKKMNRSFSQTEKERDANQKKLAQIKVEILEEVSGSAIASDQFSRAVDLAVDYCEDVAPLPQSCINKIVRIFHNHGAKAKVSSIHVNGWFGDHDKLSTSLAFLKDRWDLTSEADLKEKVLFVGDSLNDEPMFKFFDYTVGVKNIETQLDQFTFPPEYLCSKKGGYGFQELTKYLI